MTNHWRDLKNADLILINGANPAEAHPVGFQWFLKAKLDPTKGPGNGGGPGNPGFGAKWWVVSAAGQAITTAGSSAAPSSSSAPSTSSGGGGGWS